MVDRPNVVERLEELAEALERAQTANNDGKSMDCGQEIEHAYGVAGEILTMIDGR